jgi:hypothetical protein
LTRCERSGQNSKDHRRDPYHVVSDYWVDHRECFLLICGLFFSPSSFQIEGEVFRLDRRLRKRSDLLVDQLLSIPVRHSVGVFVIRNTRSDLNYSAWSTSKTKKIGRRQTYPASRSINPSTPGLGRSSQLQSEKKIQDQIAPASGFLQVSDPVAVSSKIDRRVHAC